MDTTARVAQLTGVNIVGKNLLNVECDQFNKMRLTNRKFYYCPSDRATFTQFVVSSRTKGPLKLYNV